MHIRKTDKLLPILVCPETGERLVQSGQYLKTTGGKLYPVTGDGKIFFIGVEAQSGFVSHRTEPSFGRTEKRDVTDTVKGMAKKWMGRYYILLEQLIAPVMPRLHWGTLQTYWSYLVKQHAKNKDLVIQIGSGTERISDEILNIDIFDFPEVDIVADCRHLPFEDGSVDGVVSLAMLEHVSGPDEFLREAHRVLKPGGFIITGVPFIQPYHASPSDFYRWTHTGLISFHERHGFITENIVAYGGPTSGFLWALQEWLAIFLSFGLTPLYYFWWTLLTLTLFPVKLLDILLIHFKMSYKLNSFYLCIAGKPLR